MLECIENADEISIKRNDTISFSIIMPCYNSEAYVQDAINSVVKQTYSNWELLAINDGSTDRTLEILMDNARIDNRIKVYSKSNGGYVSAVNLGLEKMTGDYFLLMGSDDKLTNTIFSDIYDTEKRPDCIGFRTRYVKDNTILGLDKYTNFDNYAFSEYTNLAAYQEKYPMHAAIFSVRDTSKCFKREILKGLRYFGKYGIDADGIFSMLLCHNATSFLSLPVDGYLWTLREDSLSARKATLERECDRMRNWIEFFEVLQSVEPCEVTGVEKERLMWFMFDISSLWKVSEPFFNQYNLVRNAIRCVKVTRRKLEIPMNLTIKQKLLINFPVIWKIVWKTYSCFASTGKNQDNE